MGKNNLGPKQAFFLQCRTNSISTMWKIIQLKSLFWMEVIALPGITLLLCGLFCRGADKELAGWTTCVCTNTQLEVSLLVWTLLYSETLCWCWTILGCLSFCFLIIMFMHSLYICLSCTLIVKYPKWLNDKMHFKARMGRGVRAVQSLRET